MIRTWTAVALAGLVACGGAQGQQVGATAPGSDQATPAHTSVQLDEVFTDLPPGRVYASVGQGWFCGNPKTFMWRGGRVKSPNFPLYQKIFKAEMERAGYKVITPGQDSLFDSEGGAANYEIAGVLSDQKMVACAIGAKTSGDISATIDWQIYAPLDKEVVAHLKTTDTVHLEDKILGGSDKLIADAFRGNLRQLLDDPAVRTALNARPRVVQGLQVPDQQSKIALAGSLKAGSRKIADATGSVVTILDSAGSGSGFLVSSDGYVLTDAHVVGDAKTVRVRWPDGLETLATVERVSKKRDVAILKTNPRDRTPLALKRGPVTPGQRVYAIGSPMGKSFEGTVSSGVISADRTLDGLRYIQSDITVSHGSSGGPLLDEHGAVIGLTDLALPGEGPTGEMGPAGLNLFTPIGDAMDFLALEQK